MPLELAVEQGTELLDSYVDREGTVGSELLVESVVLAVLVVSNVELRYTPNPTMKIITIAMTAETPNEMAIFAFATLV